MEFVTLIKFGQVAIPEEHLDKIQALNDQRVVVSIKKYRKSRSKAQNRYYWGVVVKTIMAYSKDILGETYNKEEVHLYIINSIIGRKPEVKVVMGEHILLFKDVETSKMTTEEYAEFILKIQKHFAEKDIDIPDPDPFYGINLKEIL